METRWTRIVKSDWTIVAYRMSIWRHNKYTEHSHSVTPQHFLVVYITTRQFRSLHLKLLSERRYWNCYSCQTGNSGLKILTNDRIACRAVIEDLVISFAVYTAAESNHAFQWTGQSPNCPIAWTFRPHLIHSSLGPHDSVHHPQTASWSVQPFLHSISVWSTHRQAHRPRYVRHLSTPHIMHCNKNTTIYTLKNKYEVRTVTSMKLSNRKLTVTYNRLSLRYTKLRRVMLVKIFKFFEYWLRWRSVWSNASMLEWLCDVDCFDGASNCDKHLNSK